MNRAPILAVLVFGIVHAQDFCSVCSQHTMCIYPGTGPKCEKVLARELGKDDRAAVVDSHNRLRNRLAAGQESRGSNGGQPPAADVKTMAWDPELAKVAQRWTDQCSYGHDKCRNVARFSVGQNAYISFGSCSNWNSKGNWSSATESWYNEVRSFDRINIKPFTFKPHTGHYSQVIWANSRRVGCGYTSYRQTDKCYNYFVCNYGPGGNVQGGAMYQQGQARSSCPDSPADQRYPALCG